VGTLRLPEEEVGNKRDDGISWRNAVGDIKRRKWRKWLLKFCCSPHADSSTENYYYEDDILSNGY